MKAGVLKLWLVITMAIFLVNCDSDRIKERPDDIIKSNIDPAVLQQIVEQFPEGTNIQATLPALFEASAQKQIVLSEESNVYLAYISEGASYANSFGWYSYNSNSKPGTSSEVEVHLLFPHVSDRILRRGDMLQLGESKFPAGTVIGFFLIIHGWDNGQVNYDGETFYTDYEFNTDDQQQHVLFKQKSLGNLILTFEDQLTSQESDKDFNDILFMVTDNKSGDPVTRVNMTNIPEVE
jgi:hypothetical protein